MSDPATFFAPATLPLEATILACGARLVREPAVPHHAFAGLATDSRAVRPGCLFVALAGERFDGATFADAALDSGAAGVLVAETRARDLVNPGAVLAVPDALRALGDIARSFRASRPARLVALTGSAGKTTTKEMLAAICVAAAGDPGAVLATHGNLNNLVGVPLTLLHLEERHRWAVIEMGTSGPGEIARLAAIADPDVGIVLNASAAHLAGFGSVDAVARGKGEMYRGLRPGATACVPSYDARLLGEARNVQPGVRVITFGERTDDEVRLHQVTPRGFDGIVAVLSVGGFLFEAPIPLLGTHLGYNALAAAAAAHALGLGPPSIARGLAAVAPVPGRLCPVRDLDGVDVLDDTYNANPASVLAGLEVLSTLSGGGGANGAGAPAPRRAVAVLGDMLELGPGSAAAHAQIGAGLVAAGVERALLFGPEMRHAAGALASAGFADRAFHTESFETARDRLLEDVRAGDVVLVKGSRGMRTERFIEALRAARPLRALQK